MRISVPVWEMRGTGFSERNNNAMANDNGQLTLKKFRRHLRTVTHHRHLVFKHCRRCGLLWQGLTHDLSKYSPAEFLTAARYYQGDRSPNDAERKEKGASSVWMHHKGRNRHHYEYWTDYRHPSMMREGELPVAPVRMPRRYVAEMLMDRIAASKTYLKEAYTQHEPLKYLLRGKSKALMHPQTYKELERMLRILDREGEQALHRFVRDYYLKGYPI